MITFILQPANSQTINDVIYFGLERILLPKTVIHVANCERRFRSTMWYSPPAAVDPFRPFDVDFRSSGVDRQLFRQQATKAGCSDPLR